MKKNYQRFVLIILIGLISFLSYRLAAQVPQGINYQAVARDNTGQPLIQY